MAYQNSHKQHHNRNHYNGWRCPSNEYEVYEAIAEEPAYPIRNHRHHDHKGHVALYEEPAAQEAYYYYPKGREAESETSMEENFQRARFGDHNAFKSVDQEADAFIQYEHERMELAKFMSMRPMRPN